MVDVDAQLVQNWQEGIGLAVGAGAGVALGSIPLGAGVGVVLGAAIGAALTRGRKATPAP